MIRLISLGLPLAFGLALPVWAEMPEGITHFTLDNGLETVVIEDHRAPVVVQMVWYKVGSADERPGKSGIAHYLEHLMFKGTDKLAPGQLSKTVTANGGSDNAFTSYDFTAYFQRIASDRLPLVMEMESDRMQNLRIGEDDWQAERQVVLEERAQRTDSDPAALFSEERNAVQFYNHPYGRPVIGWRSEMEGLTRADAIDWYDRHYAPNDAVLVIAGDVTAEQARALAQTHYGAIPRKPDAARGPRPQEPEQRAPRRIEASDPRVAQPVMVRTMLVPERNAGDQQQAAALTVLAELLGGGMQTSVLGRELAMTGKALWVNAGYDGLTVDPTIFAISLVPADSLTPDGAEAQLDAALARFAQSGPTPEDLDRVKTSLRAEQIYARDSAHGRAYDYGQGLAVGLTVEDVNAWPDILASVTAEQVTEAARDLIASTATVTGWLMPADDAAEAKGAEGGAGAAAPAAIPAAATGPAAEGSAEPLPRPGPDPQAEAAPAARPQGGNATPPAPRPGSETAPPPTPATPGADADPRPHSRAAASGGDRASDADEATDTAPDVDAATPPAASPEVLQ